MPEDKDKDKVEAPQPNISKDKEEDVVDIDTSDMEKEVAEAVKAKVSEELMEKLTGEKDKKWQPKSYEEIKDTTKKEIREEFETKEKEREKKREETEKAKSEEEKKKLADWNTYWDGQIKKLAEEKKIPEVAKEVQEKIDKKEVLTEEDRKDPGIQARVKLFDLGRQNKESNLELVYYKHYSKGGQPTGAKAPVFGARKAVTTTPTGEFTWEEIHRTPMEDIIRGK